MCIIPNFNFNFKWDSFFFTRQSECSFLPFVYKSICWQIFFKIGVLKKFHKFHRKTSVLESNFNKVARLICYNFIKKKLLIVPCSNTGAFLAGRPMLCELNWYVETPVQVSSCEFCEIVNSYCILSQDAKHQNTTWQLHSMDSLFDGKCSQRGNTFLFITEAYLEPSRKSTMKLFCKIS